MYNKSRRKGTNYDEAKTKPKYRYVLTYINYMYAHICYTTY